MLVILPASRNLTIKVHHPKKIRCIKKETTKEGENLHQFSRGQSTSKLVKNFGCVLPGRQSKEGNTLGHRALANSEKHHIGS